MQRSHNISLSKTLSWLLRHAAREEGLRISSEGFVPVSELLNHRSLKGKYKLEDIVTVVEDNDKQRFTLCTIDGVQQIRANQGHSSNIAADIELEQLTASLALDIEVIHGTFRKFWPKIKREGLSRMTRNHIHFATGLPGDRKVVSGIRKNCEIFIYIDIKLAISEGIRFYRSVNGVILSPGDSNGYIKPKYFKKVSAVDGSLIN